LFNVLTGTLRYLTMSVNTHRSSPNLQFTKMPWFTNCWASQEIPRLPHRIFKAAHNSLD